MGNALLMILLILMALFMILLVLVQRGRGGGLAGALGGAGGQSAFGAKAGDTFTRITMWAAFIWIFLCVVAVKVLSGDSGDALDRRAPGVNAPAPIGATTEGADQSSTPPATGDNATGAGGASEGAAGE